MWRWVRDHIVQCLTSSVKNNFSYPWQIDRNRMKVSKQPEHVLFLLSKHREKSELFYNSFDISYRTCCFHFYNISLLSIMRTYTKCWKWWLLSVSALYSLNQTKSRKHNCGIKTLIVTYHISDEGSCLPWKNRKCSMFFDDTFCRIIVNCC